ncbi:polysaccharide biosynthesis/export family protein [Catenovulum maritimum]|uniref:Uncharacterized protein n=1 Tax=Catenovulum maritimum TaxID=1513271 RepID=A0A0J8GUT5_9ALTE|nr:polysaccharide biosynthesis/export family protein [Catenovulum maritimum]KMT64458.1 hypothetical protein XM47_14295 [Catenovulum maritimum]
MVLKRLLILVFLWSGTLNAAQNDYILGTGDAIQILVYDEPDLTFQTHIGKDGDITFPFLGEIKISGKTTRQVQNIITEGLRGDYLTHPSVQVSVVDYRPFYIHGEVRKPGAYPYKPGLTIDQAIALAGGMTERASEQKIFVKTAVNQAVTAVNVDIGFVLSPGDTVTIRQSFF